MPFLPDDYEPPKQGGNYLKPSKLDQGDNRMRFLGDAIVGAEGWKTVNGKPKVIRKPRNVPWQMDEVDDPEKIRPYMGIPVWLYSKKAMFVLNITQAGIIRAIAKLAKDADWGEPTGYDIIISRSGDGLDTEYAVIPKPKSAVPKDALEAWKKALEDGFSLPRMFDGGNPFGSGAAATVDADADISF